MTDNEIIKAASYCIDDSIETCEFCSFRMQCERGEKIFKYVLELVCRQNAEIEQLKRNLGQCENGYRQQIHIMQCEYEQLQQKYNLAVAEREANVKGFAEQLARVKTEVTWEIFAEIEKVIQENYDKAQRNEEDEELEAATDYLSYVACDLYDLEEKYGVYDEN